jgi:hypothetical protein
MSRRHEQGNIRLAELVAALSLGVDLGFGQPMEHVLRQCLLALRLAEVLDVDEETRAIVYYTGLLVGVGCHTDAHEQAKWFGDDIAMKAAKFADDWGTLRGTVATFAHIGAGSTPLHRLRIGLEFLVSGRRDVEHMIANHTKLARSFAEQLGLPRAVVDSVGSAYEWWDGRGWPRGLAANDIPLPSRIAGLAEFMEVAHRVGGITRALEFATSSRRCASTRTGYSAASTRWSHGRPSSPRSPCFGSSSPRSSSTPLYSQSRTSST